ncbi:MAG TPA: DJ-1 family protein [Candidatus Atribacteria bacterium]|nr:DJ-1 family protein [Candidatus Atribacteria bacterium]
MANLIDLKINKIIIFIILLILVLLFFYNLEGGVSETMSKIQGKKVLMIIASHDFRDEELFKPRELFIKEGMEVVLASSSLETSRGMLGGTAKPDILISEAKAEEFDVIVFVGGMGSSEYWDDPVAREIVKKAVSLDRLICAICIAPVTLANAGILEGKKATVFPSEANKLKNKGAIYTGKDVEVDGNIITAKGPQAASEFGKTIIRILTEKLK